MNLRAQKRIRSVLKFCIFGLMLELLLSDVGFSKSNILTVACVNFRTSWGDKAKNLEKMKGYITAAAKRGADLIVFPELALTGYDVEEKVLMHRENAETVPGPSTSEIAVLTHKFNVYVIFGLPEKDTVHPDTFYNSAAVIGPDGIIGSYAKIVPTGLEIKWCKKGKKPFCFDTPWGLIGVGICYDTYMFPELPRFYAALGARLYIHITALDSFPGWKEYYYNQLQARAIENMMFVASSNLAGRESSSNFLGNSLILGPGGNHHDIRYYARALGENNEDIVLATIDLAEADRVREDYPLFIRHPSSREPDWNLRLFREMLETIDEKTNLGKSD